MSDDGSVKDSMEHKLLMVLTDGIVLVFSCGLYNDGEHMKKTLEVK